MKIKPESSKRYRIILSALLAAFWSSAATAVVQESQYFKLLDAYKNSSKRSGVHAMATMQAPQIAEIDSLTLDPTCAANDHWCGGTMIVGGQTVIIPRNLLIDMPAARLTLKELFEQAPPDCLAAHQSGLALNDTCKITTKGAVAALSANHDDCGRIIAADLFIQDGPEAIQGPVTFINYSDGYFRVGGTVGTDVGGTMVRINDPSGTSTVQQGLGCLTGSQNCSPDVRFTSDSVNYTASFSNGYPLCIPSQLMIGGHTIAADANGVGDPFCPDTNRTAAVAPNFFVQDSRRFAPMKLGDNVLAMGGFFTVNGVTFLSAHTVTDHLGLSTRETADQPDYVTIRQVRWDLPDFPESHMIAVFHGLTTLPDSQLDLFALRVDPKDNSSHPDPLTSTVGNPRTINKLGVGPGGKWAISLAVHLQKGAPVPPSTSPCTHLRNAGFDVCPNGGTLDEEFSILMPPSREVQALTRRTVPLAPGVFTLDMQGRHASNSQFTIPLGANLGGFILAEPGEADLGKANGPVPLEALPWTLDRRVSPNGCLAAGCDATFQPLAPYPSSGIDMLNTSVVNLVPATAVNREITYFNFVNGALVPGLLPFPPVATCAGGAETLKVTSAVFHIFTKTWTVSGTSSVASPGNQVTIFSGPTTLGQVIGTAPVDILGNWSFTQANSPVPPATSVSIQSTLGAQLLNNPVTILN